jgi:hypothetical protein
MARYDELKAEWERGKQERTERRRETSELRTFDPREGLIAEKLNIPISAADFLATMQSLASHTQDRRFSELYFHVSRSGMIDFATGDWCRDRIALANPDAFDICLKIEDAVREGMSEREAFALAVVEKDTYAASFEAAHKAVERLWRAYLRLAGRPKVSR